MHFIALVSGALAALLATGASAACSSTSRVDDICSSEGAFSCDASCTNVVICHDGRNQINNKCNPGCCQIQGNLPFCAC